MHEQKAHQRSRDQLPPHVPTTGGAPSKPDGDQRQPYGRAVECHHPELRAQSDVSLWVAVPLRPRLYCLQEVNQAQGIRGSARPTFPRTEVSRHAVLRPTDCEAAVGRCRPGRCALTAAAFLPASGSGLEATCSAILRAARPPLAFGSGLAPLFAERQLRPSLRGPRHPPHRMGRRYGQASTCQAPLYRGADLGSRGTCSAATPLDRPPRHCTIMGNINLGPI